MAEERVQRRLAAILAADVVGYSRLMEADEAGTLRTLKARRREVLNPLVANHRGRIFKVTGDGVLVEFASAVDAVECAIGLQKRFAGANADLPEARCILLRIGINLGDVIVEGNDLYGDGVNVAARLESLAEPGGICVSRSVYDQVRRRLDSRFDELGPQPVKNIAEPVHVYRVRLEQSRPVQERLPLPAKPSIAVLPFTSMSSDPDQETFVDGLTEDLITDLSRNPGLFVIARNSTFAYKGKSVDARQIARDLGVRHLLEGSARRAGGRVRINVQLIDAIGGGHVWAERFDRSLDDVFAVQDEVTAKIVEALVGRLTADHLPERKRTSNVGVYDLCVRARSMVLQSPQGAQEAKILLERAISLDPNFSEAHRWLAIAFDRLGAAGTLPIDQANENALASAQKAVELDPNDAGAHWTLGTLLANKRAWAHAESELATALSLDPNNADAWAMRSELMVLKGRATDALSDIEKALRLNPHPPGWYHWFLGQAHYLARRYDRAVSILRNDATYRTESRRTLAASLAQMGELEEARAEADLFMVSNPRFTIGNWIKSTPFEDEAAAEHFIDGYRKAGLPE